MEKINKASIGNLYNTFRTQAEIYQDVINGFYEQLFHGSLKKENLTPAEIIDNLAMVMYYMEGTKFNERA